MTENRASVILETMTDGFIALDREWRCIYINAAGERLLQQRRQQLVGTRCEGLFSETSGGFVDQELKRAASERSNVELEYYHEPWNRWFEIRVVAAPDDELFVYLRDVTSRKHIEERLERSQAELMEFLTDRKHTEDELQASEERFSRFMENLPGLAWMKDMEGRYFYVNAAAGRAFRMPLDVLYGQTDADIFTPETAAQFRENDRLALESSEGILTVESLEQDDGVLHHSIVSKFPVLNLQGRATAVGGMAIDITDRIRAENALLAADRRKDEFLAMLAHELRNPLAPILTAVEIQRMVGSSDPVLARQRDVINRQVKQMKRLLDDLLDVSRITRGKIQLVTEPVSLAAILNHAVETSRPLIEELKHTLQVSLSEVPMEIEADLVRLSQVFTNILNNAARYTPTGGTIWLTAEPEGENARIAVKDTGVGMTPEVLAEAFDLFVQGNCGLDRSQGGLGIGLTLARELVGLHGGTIRGHSAGINQGSEFIITLPLRNREPAEAAGDVPGQTSGFSLEPSRSHGGVVLVVDDNIDHAEGLALILRMEGYEVFVAHTGTSALEQARAHQPQIGILDIGLPGMDGYELARRLRKEPGLTGMFLVAVTGYAREEDRSAAKASGFNRHLAKPLEARELLSLLPG